MEPEAYHVRVGHNRKNKNKPHKSTENLDCEQTLILPNIHVEELKIKRVSVRSSPSVACNGADGSSPLWRANRAQIGRRV